MTLAAFKFFYWLTFIWCGVGMLFIAGASIKEMISQIKTNHKAKLKEKSEATESSTL
ncbi:MAG TPA: hypothetical protein VNM45_04190 [Bacillus sp. (in: firmicutes)]|nr:hypothetical protein [Bacillus sp. (in: firmicutes)]